VTNQQLFSFDYTWRSSQLDPLLLQIDLTREQLRELPFPPRQAQVRAEEDLHAAVAASAVIAGIQVQSEEVRALAARQGQDAPRLREVRNLLATYRFLATVDLSTPFPVSEQLLCSLHRYCTGKNGSVHEHPGCYRTNPVHIRDRDGRPVHRPPQDHEAVVQAMRRFIHCLNTPHIQSLHPLLRAGLAHCHLCLIHPFEDGNGRVARLLETLVLGAAAMMDLGLMLTVRYSQHQDAYFQAFVQTLSRKNDWTPFLAFLLEQALAALRERKDDRLAWVRRVVLEQYHADLRKEKQINDRQHALLALLVDWERPVRLADLLERPPFFPLYRRLSTQTARRDLARLVALGLLKQEEQGLYSLNLELLLGH